MKFFKTRKRLTAFIAALAVLITSAALLLNGAFAEAQQIAYTNPYTPTGTVRTLDLADGTNAKLENFKTDYAYTWVSGDTAIVSASPAVATDTTTVTAKSIGWTTISAGTTKGEVTAFKFQVVDSRNIASYAYTNTQQMSLGKGEQDVEIAVDVRTGLAPDTANSGKDQIAWSSAPEGILTLNGDGTISAENVNDTAMLIGTFKDKWGSIQQLVLMVKVGNGGGDVQMVEWDGKYWVPVDGVEYVYIEVNQDGQVENPSNFIWSKDPLPNDSEPNTEDNRPAYGPKDGVFYVEDPAGSNIYKPLDNSGNILEDGAIWGGDDRKFGSGDDSPAIKNNDKWYADLGQNVFQEINTEIGKLIGDLIGGGPNKTPGDPLNLTTNNIFLNENDGKYYAGPFSDAEGTYFVGDKRPADGGILSFNYDSSLVIHESDRKYYLDDNGDMLTNKPTIPVVEPESILSVRIEGEEIVNASDHMVSFPYTVIVEGIDDFTDKANWTVTGIDNAAMVPSLNSKVSYLRLPAYAEGTVKIIAKAVGDENVLAEYEVTVRNTTIWANTPINGEFRADGVDWVVIGRNMGPSGNDMMIMTKYVHSVNNVRWYTTGDGGYTYYNSMFQTAVDTFYGNLGMLHSYAVMPKKHGVTTAEITSSNGEKAGTETKGVMFPLSLAEITGIANPLKIGYDVDNKTVAAEYWTRSTFPSYYAYYVSKSGGTSTDYRNYSKGMRPVMFVNFES